MRDDDGDRTCDDGSAEHLLRRNQGARCRAERDELATEGMVLAVEIDTVERFLERILVEGRTQVVRHLGRGVELNLFAE
jgi:hypothetical protein